MIEATCNPWLVKIILTTCPAFIEGQCRFLVQILLLSHFSSLCPTFFLFFYWFLGSNLSLNLIIFSYFYQICKNVSLQIKSPAFSGSLSLFLLQAGWQVCKINLPQLCNVCITKSSSMYGLASYPGHSHVLNVAENIENIYGSGLGMRLCMAQL